MKMCRWQFYKQKFGAFFRVQIMDTESPVVWPHWCYSGEECEAFPPEKKYIKNL